MEKIKKLLNKALIGFKLSNPSNNIANNLSEIILDELDSISADRPKENDIIYCLSVEDNFFGPSLIKSLENTKQKEKETSQILKIIYDDYLSRLDKIDRFYFSKNYAIFKSGSNINIIGNIEPIDLEQIQSTLIETAKNKENIKITFYKIYFPGEFEIDDIKVIVDEEGNIKIFTDEVEYGCIERSNNITEIKNPRLLIHDLVPILINILNTNSKEYLKIFEPIDRDLIIETISILFQKYIDNIDITEVLKENGFKISKNSYTVLSSISGIKLLDSFNGKLLSGQIELSTNRGYKNSPEKPQQDAVLSIVKNENCFLNMIADGAGGSENGQEASRLLTEEIKDWFKNIPDEILNNINLLIELLSHKIRQVDNLIKQKYEKSYTTMVLTITINDKTIIANIGDSTAYTYDEGNDLLIQLTTLDSDSRGMSYEDARYNPWNSALTAAIGSGYNDELHINIIDNIGQKIIISSDGITDLVSEERFKSYFKENTPAITMIEDSLSKKDTEWLDKTEDNISVIIINLPNYKKNKIITK